MLLKNKQEKNILYKKIILRKPLKFDLLKTFKEIIK